MEEWRPKPEREITPEALAENVSLIMTKPENTDTPAPLLLFLKANGLQAKTFRFTLNQEILTALYPDIQYSPGLVQATNDHLLNKQVEVFLVSKDTENNSDKSVLDQVVALVGIKINPDDNPEGTLRRAFHGETKTYSNAAGNDVTYYENGFHRPMTATELIDHLKAFGLLEEAKRLVL